MLYNYTTNEKILENVLPEAFDEETEEKVTVTFIKYSSQCKRPQTWGVGTGQSSAKAQRIIANDYVLIKSVRIILPILLHNGHAANGDF